MKTIGVYTSGGDAPGMNACVRAVVRSGLYNGCEVIGIQHGYEGMITGNFVDLGARSVSNIIQRGGTILRTARSEAFRTTEGRAQAAFHLKKAGIEGLIAIGGDGTFQGATLLSEEHGVAIVGVPGTIDNDLFGTDFTIGYDTAVNTAMESIDKIRDTAASHDRLFYVEVMGRDAGFIALDVGISSGAEYVAIPESRTNLDALREYLETYKKVKSSAIIIVAEGEEEGGAFSLAEKIKDTAGYDYRVCVLGHIQRGGSPSARDRILASRLGVSAVDALLEGQSGVMVGEIHGKIAFTPLKETWTQHKALNEDLWRLARILAT
ncbi:MAG TPA: 6-phosphofructokinase [Bacteroidota bacterium]|nr:6-phosphofructokinase [Bacteroidota bacterium]